MFTPEKRKCGHDALEDTVLSISCGAKAVRQYSKIIRLSGCAGELVNFIGPETSVRYSHRGADC